MMFNKKISVFFKLIILVFLLIGCNVSKTDNEGNEISEKDLKATSSAKEQKTLSLNIDKEPVSYTHLTLPTTYTV